jgi:CO/xanthine dehydrogenase Mo-binding subunit
MAPAIANAVFKLSGVRMRELPMLPARVKLALNEAGTRTA